MEFKVLLDFTSCFLMGSHQSSLSSIQTTPSLVSVTQTDTLGCSHALWAPSLVQLACTAQSLWTLFKEETYNPVAGQEADTQGMPDTPWVLGTLFITASP